MKRFVIILGLIPSLAFSFTDAEKDIFTQENIKVLQSKGLPTPDSGVELVPRSSLMSSDWQKQKDEKANLNQKKLGYVKEDSARAQELLHFDEVVKTNQAAEAKMYKPSDTHLRHSVSDVLMAYTYVGVPEAEMKEFLGIAPAGSYVNSPTLGWSGAVEFFRNSIGTCAYTENNLRISHGAARIAQEDARKDVNGKITLVFITGTDASGYLYRVKWFDNNFIRELECANSKYSVNTIKAVIDLAKRIDIS